MTVKELKKELNKYPDDMLVSTPIWSSIEYDLVNYVCKRERSMMDYHGPIEEVEKYPYKKDNKITVVELEGDYA